MSHDLYRHYDKEDNLLYVGISLSAASRLAQHKKHSLWYEKITKMTIEKFDSRKQLCDAEVKAIINERPEHNIQHMSDIDTKKVTLINEISKRKSDSELFLIDKIVNVKIKYTLDEVNSELGFGKQKLLEFIEDGTLPTVIVRRQWNSYHKKEVIKRIVTGWQMIDFLDYLTSEEYKNKLRKEYESISDKDR